MSEPVDVSVIIPCYNGGSYLIEQLVALQQQHYDGCWEVLVVDNRSDDGTDAAVERFQTQMPNLRLVRADERRNKSYARNTGVQAARSSRLAFIDADDMVSPGWLAAMAAVLRDQHLVAGAFETRLLNQGAPYRPPVRNNLRSLNFLTQVTTANMGVSREAFDAVGGFDEAFLVGQDVDFSWRVQLAGYQPVVAPEAIVHYRFRRKVMASVIQMFYYCQAHVQLYAKFKPYGMPRSSLRVALKEYRWLLVNLLPFLRPGRRHSRQAWLMKLVIYLGHLWGSIRYRRFYP